MIFIKCLVATAVAMSCVNGHGYMSKPESTWSPTSGDKTQFIASIDSSTSGLPGTYNTAPDANVASFTTAFKASNYKSIKELIEDKAVISVTGASLTCGNANPDAPPQPLPEQVEWSHSAEEGFTPSHQGPCEVWCDNKQAFHDENCAAHFTTAPAQLSYEKTMCSGASKLTLYWIAMHGPIWQVYINCANISGGSGEAVTTQPSDNSITSPSTPAATPLESPSLTPNPPSTSNTPSTSTSTSTSPSSSLPPSTSTPTYTSPTTADSDESDCGSYDIAGNDDARESADENQENVTQVTTGSDFSPSSPSTIDNNVDQQSPMPSGDNSDQFFRSWVHPQMRKAATLLGSAAGSQSSYNFKNIPGKTSTGTVKPQNN
ncbi:uncharacterized protein PHALS_01293 [Plasmopara halstedii]|uniref:RxLR-like protein n=1 Tax=Plasmopara halstedii TaxID=4781 RepID=A0A0P1AWE0_PLAHL|nr:uncharacterized protein PHALS_01293 [Plasmopara halstedii]CEG44970.1 hypothetical protein PHALS_01293 [Plasmopara halstedii]|eukprot:XP_024581339.1 hypothetical protein PHALS_01293 [Plasmopara halstedii]